MQTAITVKRKGVRHHKKTLSAKCPPQVDILVFCVILLSEFRVFDVVYFFCTANIVIYRLLFIM